MKPKFLILLIPFLLSGCVSYKYPTNPDGSQIQIGSYMENDVYSHSHFFCTKKGKIITEMNKKAKANNL